MWPVSAHCAVAGRGQSWPTVLWLAEVGVWPVSAQCAVAGRGGCVASLGPMCYADMLLVSACVMEYPMHNFLSGYFTYCP